MKKKNWKDAIKNYVVNNYKEYLLVAILFIIGLFIGVFIINNSSESDSKEISKYFNDFITNFNELDSINKSDLIRESIQRNLIMALILWGAGTTVIGIPIVLISILLRGLSLGYTIATITVSLGKFKGVLFCLASIFLQNILLIPAILTIGVSSIKLYKSIIKDKRKENIKIEIIRHTIISILMIITLCVSSILENVISITILKKIIKYFVIV